MNVLILVHFEVSRSQIGNHWILVLYKTSPNCVSVLGHFSSLTIWLSRWSKKLEVGPSNIAKFVIQHLLWTQTWLNIFSETIRPLLTSGENLSDRRILSTQSWWRRKYYAKGLVAFPERYSVLAISKYIELFSCDKQASRKYEHRRRLSSRAGRPQPSHIWTVVLRINPSDSMMACCVVF